VAGGVVTALDSDAPVLDPSLRAPSMRSFDELAAVSRGCVACPELAACRLNVVPGVAPAGARAMFIGEAPGAQEDAEGVPFVGKCGGLLDELLADIEGLSRDSLAVSNVLKCRPPRNRKPRRAEVERCRPWLEQQISLVDPEVIVALGGSATEWFFGPSARIGVLRGSIHSYAGRKLLVTYHPSAAIRFGPRGMPRAALAEDLRRLADLLHP
jgi:DNA polymerase